jgi:5-methylcytosine-specific restriction endonuclease McrA
VSEYVPAATRRRIRDRVNGCCEYCLIHEDDVLLPHEPDHIIATKHRGTTDDGNLAWTCFVCNRGKGSDLSSIDIETGKLIPLFNPRTDRWSEHFRLDRDGRIVPLTDVGRVTEYLLKFNRPEHVELRRTLVKARRYPRQ